MEEMYMIQRNSDKLFFRRWLDYSVRPDWTSSPNIAHIFYAKKDSKKSGEEKAKEMARRLGKIGKEVPVFKINLIEVEGVN